MNDPIVKIYVDLVRAGRRFIEQVPDTIRLQVNQFLNE